MDGTERSFFGVFNTFVNQWCEKLNKNVLNLALRLLLLPEFLKYWILPHIKKFNFRHYRQTKMLQIIVFWSNQNFFLIQRYPHFHHLRCRKAKHEKWFFVALFFGRWVFKSFFWRHFNFADFRSQPRTAKFSCRENLLP